MRLLNSVMSYVAGQLSETKYTAPVTCHLDLNGMDVSITHLTLLVYIDLDSVMELTYPVCLKLFENIKNNKDWATNLPSPTGILLHSWYTSRS